MSRELTRAEWEELRRDAMAAIPQLALDEGLPSVLLPYQQRAVSLLDSAGTSVLIYEKSRRIGLTWALAAYAVLRAGRAREAGGMDTMYISYSQEMTREFIDACAMWARAFAVAAGAAEETLFPDSDETGDRSIKAFRIQFASGFEIIALSSAPRSLRGKQGVVIIDEAAFVDSLAQLMKSALAFLMWGGQVVVCSTHDGVDNHFNVLVQDVLAGRLPYQHLRTDFDQALQDGLYQRICLVTKKAWTPATEAAWRADIVAFYGEGADEELFCVPTMGSGAWLASPLIEARMTADAPCLELALPADFLHRDQVQQGALMEPFNDALKAALEEVELGPQFAFGFDFARVADLSVGCLLAVEERLRRREVLTFELRGVPGDEQKRIVAAVLDRVRPGLVGAAFDATGMGWTVAEDMGRRFGFREAEDAPGIVWAIKFSEEWYRLQMPPLKAAFEDDMIALGPSAAHLADLRSVKIVRGIARVPPVREGVKGLQRHGDYAIALALAHFASRMRWAEYGYRPVEAAEREPLDLGPPDDFDPKPWLRRPIGARLRGHL